MISSTATTAAVAPLSSTTHRIDAMGSDDGDDGFVMNLAGMEDAGGDDSERRGNPRKRTVMRAPRKGRHRGWLGGKSTDGAAKPGPVPRVEAPAAGPAPAAVDAMAVGGVGVAEGAHNPRTGHPRTPTRRMSRRRRRSIDAPSGAAARTAAVAVAASAAEPPPAAAEVVSAAAAVVAAPPESAPSRLPTVPRRTTTTAS